MATTASSFTDVPFEFRVGQTCSRVSSSAGFLTRGSTTADDYYLRTQQKALGFVHPRPPADLPTTSVWNKWVSNAPWYVYPSAYGGSFPYIWTLEDAPAGMTIESVLEDPTVYANRAKHGRIYWASPTAGDHTFYVRCTDQEGRTKRQKVVLNIADSNAIWCDPVGGSDSAVAAGTKAAPFKKIDNWYANTSGTLDPADNRHDGKIVIYRAGTLTVPVDTGAAGVLDLSANKPVVHVAYYGETVTLDCTNSRYKFFTSGNKGKELIGLTFSGQYTGATNSAQVTHTGAHVIFCDHTISDFTDPGTDGTNNPSGIVSFDAGDSPSLWHDYQQFRNIRIVNFSDAGGMGSTGGALRLFTPRYYEVNNVHLVSQNGTAQHVLSLKHEANTGVVRFAHLLDGQEGGAIGVLHVLSGSNTVGEPSPNNEVEYCVVTVASGTAAFYVNDSNLVTQNGYPGTDCVWIRRCTFSGALARLSAVNSGTAVRQGNVIQNATPGFEVGTGWTFPADSLEVTGTSGIVDSGGLLTGASRTSYLYKRGWEMAAA